jgi:hypothetical protein
LARGLSDDSNIVRSLRFLSQNDNVGLDLLLAVSYTRERGLLEEGGAMDVVSNRRCESCHSENEKTFTAEIAIHFSGLVGLTKPIVLVSPRITVCMDCGLARFAVPEKELQVLRTGAPVEGAIWLPGSKSVT